MRILTYVAVPFLVIGCMKTADDAAVAPVTAPPPVATAPVATPVAEKVTAKADLSATEGHTASGSLSLEVEPQGLRIRGELAGLDANGEHGFHIHENGDCSAPDASSAGAHFNPHGSAHGKPDAGAHHAGDMFNVTADAQGAGRVDALVTGVSLRDGDAGDVLGKAIVVHKKADDYVSQPSGDSGDRIACGVIR